MAQHAPNDGREGEQGEIYRIGDNNASQIVWKTTACPGQKKSDHHHRLQGIGEQRRVWERTQAGDGVPTPGGQQSDHSQLAHADEQGAEAQGQAT